MSTHTIPLPKPAAQAGSQLVALELNERETWFTLSCAACGDPIAPPESGNLVWDAPDGEGTPLAPFEDADKVVLLDAAVHAVHKACDPEDRLGRCWTPLDAVLRLNQNRFDLFRQSREYAEFAKWKARREQRARAKLLREFRELCKLEPRLAALFKQAKSVTDDPSQPSFCANAIWYGYGDHSGLKPILCELVGHAVRRRNGLPELSSSRGYDVAYHAIYDALPACRNCACL